MTRWTNRGGIKVLTGRERCICGEVAIKGTCSAWLRKWAEARESEPDAERCRSCNVPTVPEGHVAPEGYVNHQARGLCQPCYSRHKNTGTLRNFPRTTQNAADLLAELEHLGLDEDRPLKPQLAEFAPQLGKSAAALEKAYHRARKAAA